MSLYIAYPLYTLIRSIQRLISCNDPKSSIFNIGNIFKAISSDYIHALCYKSFIGYVQIKSGEYNYFVLFLPVLKNRSLEHIIYQEFVHRSTL